jgi:DNA-binding response OmpR family regulator
MRDDPARLLIVEDDDELSELLVEYLGRHGFEIDRVASGHAGAERIAETHPDVVILDLMLPGTSGLDVCRQIRDAYAGAIMLLTASQSDADHVAGLELGADDFVTKPIEPRVLLARIRTQLRRLRASRGPDEAGAESVIELESLRIDITARDVVVNDRGVPLTSLEFDVVVVLATHVGSVVSRDELYERVLGAQYDGIDRGMDVHVSRIRRKLQSAGFDPGRLRSVRGTGYVLAAR